jgi:hypothetical protein
MIDLQYASSDAKPRQVFPHAAPRTYAAEMPKPVTVPEALKIEENEADELTFDAAPAPAAPKPIAVHKPHVPKPFVPKPNLPKPNFPTPPAIPSKK